jgi:hypothetical protein
MQSMMSTHLARLHAEELRAATRGRHRSRRVRVRRWRQALGMALVRVGLRLIWGPGEEMTSR